MNNELKIILPSVKDLEVDTRHQLWVTEGDGVPEVYVVESCHDAGKNDYRVGYVDCDMVTGSLVDWLIQNDNMIAHLFRIQDEIERLEWSSHLLDSFAKANIKTWHSASDWFGAEDTWPSVCAEMSIDHERGPDAFAELEIEYNQDARDAGEYVRGWEEYFTALWKEHVNGLD